MLEMPWTTLYGNRNKAIDIGKMKTLKQANVYKTIQMTAQSTCSFYAFYPAEIKAKWTSSVQHQW